MAAWLLLGSCSRGEETKTAENSYVDARSCAGCHAEIAKSYAKSGMARAFYRVNAESVPEPKAYFHKASSTWYQNVARGGEWYQRWWQTGTKGQEVSAGEAKIDYVMGSGNHVRTYIHRTARNTLIELPMAWYAEKGGSWAMNPGFDMSDPPVGRKIGYDCMFCHNAYPKIPAGHDDAVAEPVFVGDLPEGIDCQRCHGPGGNHVRAVQSGAKAAEIQGAIVNPARLGKDRAMEVCMQCHLETTSGPLPQAIRRYERGPFSFRAGEALSAFQLYFDHAAGTGRDGKFEIVNSVYRLRQSRCFLETKGKPNELGCSSCHNPHEAQHGKEAAAQYNQVCSGCHKLEKAHPAGDNCVGCHMPKRRTEDVVHVVMTDHLIQRRVGGNLLAEFPERHDAGLEYRGEVAPYGDSEELYTAVAQVMHQSNLTNGIPRLQTAMAKQKSVRPEVDRELGDALQRAGRSEEAAGAYRVALDKKPDSAVLWARLAMPLRAMGKTREPLEAMLKSVALDPKQPEVWNNLGLLQSGLGDKEAAKASFRKSIELDAEFAESHSNLGVVLAETGQIAEAETEFGKALRIRPALQVPHSQLAYMLANRGEFVEAVWHFERAGEGAANQLSYGITLARMNRLAEARVRLEKSLAADARQPLAHEVLGGLLEAAGKSAEAAAHYREAIRLQPDFGRAHLALGAWLLRRGDRTGAAAEFRLAMGDADAQIRERAAAGLAAAGGR